MESQKSVLKLDSIVYYFFFFIGLCISCKDQPEKPKKPEVTPPPSYERIITGSLAGTELTEVSGITRSNVNPGYYWVHNDSGNAGRIFLIDSTGSVKKIVNLKDVSNRDWEDIATYKDPASGKSYVYIGEIGDNFLKFKYKYIYRFEEPLVSDSPNQLEIIIPEVQKVTFEYKIGNRDSETLLVDPDNGEITIITKWEANVLLFSLPLNFSWGDTLILDTKSELEVSAIVGGDISPNSTDILLKSYSKIFYWTREKGEPISAILTKPYQELEYTVEPRGEAICWSNKGSNFYTLTECLPNEECNISYYKRKSE